jgi:hypothetical protein
LASLQTQGKVEEKSHLVFVKAMVATPVIHKHHRVATHGRGMTAAASKVIPKFCCWLLWDKPDAGLATHTVRPMHPRVISAWAISQSLLFMDLMVIHGKVLSWEKWGKNCE